MEDKKGLDLKKSIRPTRKTFQGGLHQPAACFLPPDWDSCNSSSASNPTSAIERVGSFCYGHGEAGYRLLFTNNTFVSFHLDHRLDDKTSENDAKVADTQQDGVIFHMQFHRYWFKASAEAAKRENEYVTLGHFQRTIEDLHERKLFTPFFLPSDNFSDEVSYSKSFVGKLVQGGYFLSPRVSSNITKESLNLRYTFWGGKLRLMLNPDYLLFAQLTVYISGSKGDVDIPEVEFKINERVLPGQCSLLHNTVPFQAEIHIRRFNCSGSAKLELRLGTQFAVEGNLFLGGKHFVSFSGSVAEIARWHHYWQGIMPYVMRPSITLASNFDHSTG